MDEIYSKPPKKKIANFEIDVYHIDNICILEELDLKDYCPEKNRGYRFVLVVIDNFSKLRWTTPLKNEIAQRIKHFFENTLMSSKKIKFS